MIGNYATATTFKWTPGTGRTGYIQRMLINIEDVGSFDSAAYGNNITLTNGISLGVFDSSGTIVTDVVDSHNIKTNADWAMHCHDVTVHDFGLGNETLTARWTFARSGQPLWVPSGGHYFGVVLNDDFSGLVNHNIHLQGWEQ